MKNSINQIGVKKTISLIIHTKNEEKNIRACINSAKKIADEILIIDMHSTDKTVFLAKKLGAQVISVDDHTVVEMVRNFGMSKARSEWILSLDADERLTKKLVQKILEIVDENQYDIVQFPFKNILFDKWIEHTGWWPDYHPRLIRKGYLVWSNSALAHCPPILKGRILTLEPKEINAVIHYNIVGVDQFLQKMSRHIGKDTFFDKNELTTTNVLNYINGQFKWRFFDQKGYLDGTHGYVLSKFMEFYWFLHFVKYWESRHYPDFIDQEILMDNMYIRYTKYNSVKSILKLFKYYLPRIKYLLAHKVITCSQRTKKLLINCLHSN
jgi:glycosyltransferase involved in cell wall biosynthesis